MSEVQKLNKLLTHLKIESRFPKMSDHELLAQTQADLAATDTLLQQLQTGVETSDIQITAHSLLSRYENGLEIGEWSNHLLNKRFQEYTPIPNSPRIEDTKRLVEPTTTPEERIEMAEKHGFRFDKFSQLLTAVDFWKRVGPMLEQIPPEQGGVIRGQIDWDTCTFSLDHPQFKSLMNALNGSAPIDYEAAYSEFEQKFDQLKRDKYHLDEDTIQHKKATGKSPLSMPDIMSVVVIDRLNTEAGFTEDQKAELEGINNAIVNPNVKDTEKIELYRRIKEIYAGIKPSQFANLAQEAVNEVELPADHPDKVTDLEKLKQTWGYVDAIPVLGSSDDGLNATLAANAINSSFPNAFMIPSGGKAPFQFVVDDQKSDTTEAEHMIAMVTNPDLQNNYPWKYPNAPDFSHATTLSQYDILSPDVESKSTITNANETTKRLIILAEDSDKPLHVLIATNNYHARRAKFDFEKSLQANNVPAEVRVLENSHAHLLAQPVEERNPHAWQYIWGEINKGLYTVATNKKLAA